MNIFNSVLFKVNKIIALIQKFQYILPRHSLLTIYKTFVRPYLDYGDIFYKKLESVQHNAALANDKCNSGTST